MSVQFRDPKIIFETVGLLLVFVVSANSFGLDFDAELKKQNALSDTLTESVSSGKSEVLSEDAKNVQIRLISASEPVSQEYVQAPQY